MNRVQLAFDLVAHGGQCANDTTRAQGPGLAKAAPCRLSSEAKRSPYAAALRDALKTAGLSHEWVARRLDCPRQWVTGMCDGTRPFEVWVLAKLPAPVVVKVLAAMEVAA